MAGSKMNTIRDIGPCRMTGFRLAELIVNDPNSPHIGRQVFLYTTPQGLKYLAAAWSATIIAQPTTSEGLPAAQ
jgi:hypothetical protein